MRVGPSEPPRRRRFQTATSCAGTMAGVVNVAGKGAPRERQVRAGKANESEPLKTRREGLLTMSKPRMQIDSGQAWGEPACCPGGIRRIGGASPAQAPAWNVGSCDPDTANEEADG